MGSHRPIQLDPVFCGSKTRHEPRQRLRRKSASTHSDPMKRAEITTTIDATIRNVIFGMCVQYARASITQMINVWTGSQGREPQAPFNHPSEYPGSNKETVIHRELHNLQDYRMQSEQCDHIFSYDLSDVAVAWLEYGRVWLLPHQSAQIATFIASSCTFQTVSIHHQNRYISIHLSHKRRSRS